MNCRIALGTVQFGLPYGVANQLGKVTLNDAVKILEAAEQLGIDVLDTAVAYGESEKVLGSAGVQDFRIVTKLPALPENCSDVDGWVRFQLRESLTRLGMERVYAVLLHRPDQLLGVDGGKLYRAMQLLKTEGVTQKIGISIYAPNELDALCQHFDFDLVQSPLNILDRRLVESGWAQKLSELEIELHVRSIFLQGLLLMDAAARPKWFDTWSPIWAEWGKWQAEAEVSPLQACLRYVLSIAQVDRVVVGVDSIVQLHEIMAASVGSLPGLPSWPSEIDAELINPARWNQS